MITAAGSGYSRWRGLAITRWREDVTRDVGGTYVFLRDVESGESWSASYQPSAVEPESYQVAFSEDRAEIARRDHAIAEALLGRSGGDLHLPVGRRAPNGEEPLARRQRHDFAEEKRGSGEAEDGEGEEDGHGV